MRRTVPKKTSAVHHPRAFTLIELLVVVSIITILMTLLITSVSSISKTAENAKRVNDITKLSDALEEFKSVYGVYPPSRVLLREDGDYTDTSDPLTVRSARYLRRIWSDIPISVNRRPSGDPPFEWDGNLKTKNAVLRLTGDQCLVFFLGGPPHPKFRNKEPVKLWGFVPGGGNPSPSKKVMKRSLTNTEKDNLDLSRKSTLNFEGTFPGRLRMPKRGTKMPVFTDPQAAGLVDARLGTDAVFYFSSYEGEGYVPGDGKSVRAIHYRRKLRNQYIPYHEEKFQLIFPGPDGQYSDPDTPKNKIPDYVVLGSVFKDKLNKGQGAVDRYAKDNLTNISTKRLGEVAGNVAKF